MNFLESSIFALGLSALCLSASADTLKLVSTSSTAVDNAYIYPYSFSIDGSSKLTNLLCINYDHEVTVGETWNVTEEAIPTDKSVSSQDLRALALIEAGISTGYGGFSLSDYQFADWGILDADVKSLSGYTPMAAFIASYALSEANNTNLINSGYFSNFTLYAVNTSNTTGWTAGTPQNFIGPGDPVSATPEPSSLLLAGTGLAAAAAIARRKRQWVSA